MAGIKLGSNFLNNYEAAHSLLQGSDYFRQDDWTTFSRRGQLDSYIGVLAQSSELPSFDTFATENRFDLLDADTRFTYMANELLGDKTNSEDREITYYDDDGVEQTVTTAMSDYAYTKYLLDQTRDYYISKEEEAIEQQRKDDMSGFSKFMASLAGILGEFTSGVVDMYDGIMALIEAPITAVATAITGGDVDESVRNVLGGKGITSLNNATGLRDALDKFEQQYTYLQDLDGNQTTAGKIFSSLAYSFGELVLPASIGRGLSAVGVSSKVAGRLTTSIYYGGLASNNMKELFNDSSFASVPTWQIIANGAIKAGVEYLVQIGISKAFGTSTIDRMLGITGKSSVSKMLGISARSGLKRLGVEAIHEGVEEMFQQMSNVLVDDFFSLFNQNFGQLSDWDLETFRDAFVLGALGGLVAGSFHMMTARRSASVKAVYSQKEGLRFTNYLKSKLANYEYINRYSDVNELYESIMNDNSMTNDQKIIATTQMYAMMRSFGEFYNLVGETRIVKAEQMLTALREYEYNKPMTERLTQQAAKQIMAQINSMPTTYINTLANELKAAQMTAVEHVINRSEVDTVEDEALRAHVEKYFKDNPDAENVVLTADGTTAIVIDSTTIVPIEYMRQMGSDAVLKTQAEQNMVDAVKNTKVLSNTLNNVGEIYRKITGRTDADIDGVIYNLLFNETLQRVLLQTANRDMYRLMSRLYEIEQSISRQNAKDAIYKERVKSLRESLSTLLVEYLINQQSAEYADLKVLTKAQKKYIQNQRYSKDLANRVRSGAELSEADYSVLENRVNAMPIEQDVKQQIMDNLHGNRAARVSAMNNIEAIYRNVFNSPYDNKTYLVVTNEGDAVFNEFLRSIDKTLQTIFKMDKKSVDARLIQETYGNVTRQTVIRYFRDQFREFTGGAYDFAVSRNGIAVYEVSARQQQGFGNFITQNRQLRNRANRMEGRTFVNVRQDSGSKYINSVLNKDLDAGSKAVISLQDIIYNSEYLNKSTRKAISDTYGSVDPVNTFLYLRNKFLQDSGNTVSIIETSDYDFVFVDVRPMMSMFRDTDFKVQTKNEVNIKHYIKGEYLVGRLVDTKVVIGTENKYDPLSNTITIAKDTDAAMRFAIAHEFQHAIQAENNLNGGLDYNWLSNLTKRAQREIVNDVRRHKPDLFPKEATRGSELEFELVRNFVYDSTGETQAYGAEGMDIVDYYPVIVGNRNGNTTITMPWGTKYTISQGAQSMNNSQTAKYDTTINNYAKRTYQPQMTANSLTGFIFPDGTVGFSETMWTHEQFYTDLGKQFGSKADSFKDNLIEIALNTNRFSGAFIDNMTIRINGKLNADQRVALLDFVSDALANDAKIEIEDMVTGRYAANEPGDYNAGRLLARAGINVGGNMSMAQVGDKRGRRIKADTWKNTNLKYFNKRKSIDPRIQDLIVNVDPAQLEQGLWDLIGGANKGQLNMWTLQEYIRNATEMNDYTFKKINEYVYKNPHIKTFTQLQVLVDSFDMYFALSASLRSLSGKSDWLNRKLSYKNARALYDQVATNEKTRRVVDRAIHYFEGYVDTRSGRHQYVPIELDYESARISMLKNYDGTINSVVGVAMRTKAMAILYNEHPYFRQRKGRGQTISADENVNEKESRLDFIADDSAQDAFNEIISGHTRQQLIDAIYAYTIEQAELKGLAVPDPDALLTQLERKSTDILENMYVALDLASEYGVEVNEDVIVTNELDEKAEAAYDKQLMKNSLLKRPSSYKQSIAQFANTIRNRLSLREFKKLPTDMQEMFDKNGMLKSSVYENMSRQELAELRDLFAEIADKAKRGEFEIKSDELLRQEIKDLRRKNKELMKELANRPIIEKDVEMGSHKFNVQGVTDMPAKLQNMFDNSFTKFANTDVKYLTENNERHLKLSVKDFTDANAMDLASMTAGEAEAIIDYLNNAVVISDEQSLKMFNAIKLYVLGEIYELAMIGQFTLSTEYLNTIKQLVKAAGSVAGTDLRVFASVIEKFNPAKRIIQSMARSNGVEFDEILVEEMVDALRANDIAKARDLKKQMYEDVLAKAKKGKVRRTVWDKLLSFERMAMLSSPGTWVRNISSNYVVQFMNKIGPIIGKAFTGKFKKDVPNQYQITGTKTTQAVHDFIKSNIEDSGLFALIKDGLSKWDPRTVSNKSKAADQLTRMIMASVESEVFGHAFNQNKGVKNTGYLLENFMQKVLSDNKWIDKHFKSYLGKMLTEDIANGTLGADGKAITLDNGLTPSIMNIVADAYTLAAQDYMHKFNTFTKIDQVIRERAGNAGYFLWKQLMPFAAASWNWFVEGIRYTPIGLAKAVVDFARMENRIQKLDKMRAEGQQVMSSRFVRYEAQRNIGKGVIGTIGFMIGVFLGAFGVMEIDDEDGELKIHIGDFYFDISSLTGTQGIILGAMMTNPEGGDVWDYLSQLADSLLADSSLESFFNLFRYSDSIGEYVLDLPMTIAGMFVPNALKAFNSLIQPNEIKYSSGFLGDLEYFAASLIPGFSYTLATKVDIYTGELQTKYSVPFIIDFINRMSPFKVYNYKVSDVEKMAIELAATTDTSLRSSELTGNYDALGTLTSEQITILNQKYGELNNASLTAFFNNKSSHTVQNEDGTYSTLTYSQMTADQRASAYNNILSKNAEYAKVYVWTTSGHKYYASSTMYSTLRELGIRTNVYLETSKYSGYVS